MTPAALIELWTSMAADEASATALDRRLLSVEAPVSIYACVFWPNGRYGVLVEGESAQRLAKGRIPKCRGVRLVHRTIPGAPPRTELQIILEDIRLIDIFAVLSLDLVDVARAEATAPASLRRCIDRLAMWQGLFERIPAQGLTEEQQRGLFGELNVLEWLIAEGLDPARAVGAWTGPEPKNQDFIHGGVALEVKSTLSKRHSRLSIANEKQLDERPHEILFLVHIRLEESQVHGFSLPAMVARCRTILGRDPVAAGLLEDRLLAAKYLDIHAPLYVGSWLVSSMRFFDVRDQFPRLTEANLPLGVGDISYSIIADDLANYEVDEMAVSERFMGAQ